MGGRIADMAFGQYFAVVNPLSRLRIRPKLLDLQ
jgi:hypothetical protein